jgi:hypothetical protein
MKIFFVIGFAEIAHDHTFACTGVNEFVVLQINSHMRDAFTVGDKEYQVALPQIVRLYFVTGFMNFAGGSP